MTVMDKNVFAIPLDKKTILTPDEAEVYTGIDINRLWQMTNEPDCKFVIYDGKQILFKRKQLEVYIKIKGPSLNMRRDAEFDAIAQGSHSAKVFASMGEYKKLNRMLQDNGGFLLTSQVLDAGMDMAVFYDFVIRMNLQKSDNGIYVSEDLYADKLYLLHLSFEKAVLSHETALFYHGLIDREPTCYSVTTRMHCDEDRLRRSGVTVYSLPESLLKVGVMKMQTPHGHLVPVYDMERTVCDLVHDLDPSQAELLQNVLNRYAVKDNKRIGKLMQYAEIFRIDKEIRYYLMELYRKGKAKI